MDSGNSGSLHSSSGGDEEYDSRAAGSISAFISPQPQQLNSSNHHHRQEASSMYGSSFSSSDYLDPMMMSSSARQQQNLHLLNNLDLVWSQTVSSDPNCTASTTATAAEIINNPLLASSSSLQQQPFLGSATLQSPRGGGGGGGGSSAAADQAPHGAARNPKKRSRASRRAPTTVLTTDTTNFRAMVQEFTGIPAPPFQSHHASSLFPSIISGSNNSRFDLFGSLSSTVTRSNGNSPLLGNITSPTSPQPSYLLRPSPQKPQPFLSSSSSSMADALAINSSILFTNNSTNNNMSSSIASPSNNGDSSHNNYQELLLTPQLGLLKQQHLQSKSLLNIQNPILASLLQSNHIKSTSQNVESSHLKMQGVLDEFDNLHSDNAGLAGALPGLISSDQTAASRNDNNPVSSWVGAKEGHQQGVRSNYDADYSRESGAANRKLTGSSYTSATSSSNNNKGLVENVAAAAGVRSSEGMVEAWICSSSD